MDAGIHGSSQYDENKTSALRKDMSLQLPSIAHMKVPKKKLYLCGLPFCWPLWLQRFATAKWFLAVIGLFVLVQSMLVSGITSSVITTIEKRYGLRSAESGLVVSAFDIGSLIVVIFISYFGGQGHRARWVGVGAIFVAIGAVLFAFPQFLSSPYQPPQTVDALSFDFLCTANRTNTTEFQCEAQEANTLYLLLFVLSNMIMGIGSTPIYTLGSTFIYDSVPKDDASLYVSSLYAIGAVGPAAGYLLGGFFLTFYVDLGNTLSSGDPHFLGAWWFGYLVCAGLILFFSIFLLMFPMKLQMPETKLETPSAGTPMSPVSIITETTDSDVTVESFDTSLVSFGKNLKELPKAFLSLLSNSIYMCVTFSATLEFSIVTAFMTFVPKYLQSHFSANTVTSSIITGAILVPSAGTGILLGGYIIKRLKLNMTGCAQTALLSNLLSLLLFISVFFITCNMPGIVGVNSFINDPVSGIIMTGALSDCNIDCSCDDTIYSPICSEGKTFYNPCYAGCDSSYSDILNQTIYSNCSCIPSTNITFYPTAIEGKCKRDCQSALIPFLVCLFLVTMATVCAHTPSLMVTYRCVKNDERPFAAGIQFLFFRALAYIPAPIYFGTAIDGACLLWSGATDACDNGSGSCLLYDADKFRYIFFGVAFSLKVIACFFVFLSWMLCRRQHSQHTHTTRWRRMRKKNHIQKTKKLNGRQEGTSSASSLPDITISECVSQNGNGNQNTSIPSVVPSIATETMQSSSSEASMSSSGSQKSLVKSKNLNENSHDMLKLNVWSVDSYTSQKSLPSQAELSV
ncbi:solute carrier organic anion transporter family member 5A1-like [Clavelina lepadiformis]|uniref:solute carrier organic anion transporter family member 5A1-like n=1 Tax=Clavelina lepadiformis TaxID=159417 RepID=UPI00404231C1